MNPLYWIRSNGPIEAVLVPRAHVIGGFEVWRALPTNQRQMVRSFIFFGQTGPGEFLTGQGLDVPPHPHIGLATVAYLIAGSIMHRDSLESQQLIVPGDVNWMTAGRGIAHSGHADLALRPYSNSIYGIQSWVAWPYDAERMSRLFNEERADHERYRCSSA